MNSRPTKPRHATTGFLASAGRLVTGHVAGYAVALLVAPLLARLYGPREFGLFAVFVTVASCLTVVVTGRFEQAIPSRRSTRAALAMAWAGTLATLGGVALLSLAIGPLADLLATLAGLHLPPGFAPLMALAVLAMSLYQILAAWLLRQGSYRSLAAMRVMLGVVMAAMQVVLPLLGGSKLLGLPAGQAIGFAAATLFAGLRVRRRWPASRQGDLLLAVRQAMWQRQFALFGMPAALISNLGIHGPAVLLAALYGVEVAGTFAFAQRVFTTPLTLLTNSFSRVYYFEATNGPMRDRLPQLIGQVIVRALAIAVLPIAGVAILAPLTFGPLFGSQWHDAGWVCAYLAPMVLALSVAQVVSPTFDVLGRQDRRLLHEMLCAALIAGGMLAACWLGWSADSAIVAASAGGTLGYLTLSVVARRCVARHAATAHPPAPATAPLPRAA